MGDALKKIATIVVIVVGIWSGAVAQPNDPSLQELYERHRWFELRDAIAGRKVPPLYTGAVAAAFNRRDAEKHLNEALRAKPRPLMPRMKFVKRSSICTCFSDDLPTL
jgi:hypothetical protein